MTSSGETANRKKEVSMSLKFAAVGSLTLLSPLGLSARAGGHARKFGADPCDPLLAMLGITRKAEQPRTSEDKPRAPIGNPLAR
jgi:hypothetical protein